MGAASSLCAPAADPHTIVWGCCHACKDCAALSRKAANLSVTSDVPSAFLREERQV